MQQESNRTILRQIRKITRVFLEQTHDMEKYGKYRHRVIDKKFGEDYAVVLMLKHMHNLVQLSLGQVDDPTAAIAVSDYLDKLNKFTSAIEANCNLPRSPVEKGIVARILSSHTRLYNQLLEMELKQNAIKSVNLDELIKMLQTGVFVWGNDFRVARRQLKRQKPN